MWKRLALGMGLLMGSGLAWGLWYSSTHADLDVQLRDVARDTSASPDRYPHGATLEFLDADGNLLAPGRSWEPLGLLLPQHPRFGDCESGGNVRPEDYAKCHAEYAAWTDEWAMRTRTVNVKVGDCHIARVPVKSRRYPGDWGMWWFPLQHGAGSPPCAWIRMEITIDSRRCAAA